MPAACASPIDDLRARIAALEHGSRPRRPALPTGVDALDIHLGGGLARGALHELAGGGPDAPHAAAPALFAASVLGRTRRSVLWVSHQHDVYAPALAAFGLHPDHVIYAETGD